MSFRFYQHHHSHGRNILLWCIVVVVVAFWVTVASTRLLSHGQWLVSVINIAADHQMLMTLTGQLKLTASETISRWLILKKRKNRSLSHPLGHLGVTYALHLWLVGKPMVDFIFVVIELFSLSPTVETLWAEIGWSLHFSKGVGHFDRRFQRETLPTNHSWYQRSKSDCPFVWYKNICSASFSFVTIHMCDRRTDRQNYVSQDRPRICLRGKKWWVRPVWRWTLRTAAIRNIWHWRG